MAPQRHERFYFKDGNVVFLVGDTLFNVHRYFFERDSPIFQTMFSQPSGKPGEGESDENPILLEGIESGDFAHFLSCLYPKRFGHGDLTTYAEWSAALNLAHLWEFDAVADWIAQRVEETCTLVEQIVTARKWNRQNWCWDACAKLCQRRQPLSLEEAMFMGIEEAVRISHLRERSRGHPDWSTDRPDFNWGMPMELKPVSYISTSDFEAIKQVLCLPDATLSRDR
ncbi:uncharacterized protein C8Q71DRAFT_187066 [Rhodofomes roseus]|uniref:BTB domain-containing protein n=1 Tax=Rhodofomes roseus TaxID=34475 RepID=A0ABQ8K8B5_9APHY|nr:uncharacterized protein C8Q71DRAFT_187066 [Rhodofomes roseus]KAH9833511.1 hypothetical protein C8Q71DRAFT_187066 [Rhodofomes roseus]